MTRFYYQDEPVEEIQAIIAANSRTPELVLGDLRGQVGTDRLGERRLSELIEKYGREVVFQSVEELFGITQHKTRHAISQWKDGVHEAEQFVDNDGIDLEKPIRVHVRITKENDQILFDFTGSADQTKGPANVCPPLVKAACAFCLMSLIDPYLPVNEGLLRTIHFKVREGSLLNPRFPAPVNTYNPTVTAIIDAVFQSLSETVPNRKRAEGCGSGGFTIGGQKRGSGQSYIQYELIAGGGGARFGKDGDSGTSVNHLNSKIAPVEIVETEFPVRLLHHDLIKESFGAGRYRGGLGILREYLMLEDARLSLRCAKHLFPPSGIDGGYPGRPGMVFVNPGSGTEQKLPGRCEYPLKKGDILRFERTGGGGFGNPLEREPAKVLHDVEDGYLSIERAFDDYGVVIRRLAIGFEVDLAATENLRRERRDTNTHAKP